jgi:Cu/Ag efflux protein CusF
MKRFVGALSALALVMSAGVAMAKQEASGKVEQINEEARTIMLDDGMIYRADEDVSLDDLSTGDEVTLSWDDDQGQRLVKDIDKDD